MDSIIVKGQKKLNGKISIQGSKNAVLPIMAASILNAGMTVINNCPRITDVMYMAQLLEEVGCVVSFYNNIVIIDSKNATSTQIYSENAHEIRASVNILGAMLARNKSASIIKPGGCNIGERPIDLHIEAFEKLGAKCSDDGKYVSAVAKQGLIGSDIHFSYPSVGATENAILAAVFAKGITVITNAAVEAEVEELCICLKYMGADIEGVGSNVITIKGVEELYDVVYTVKPDRIVAGTYIGACICAGGNITLENCSIRDIVGCCDVFCGMGAVITQQEDGLNIVCSNRPKAINYIETSPYPGFPTDMQPIVMSVLCMAEGKSTIVENIFSNRFALSKDLIRMGANIEVDKKRAVITGRKDICGKEVNACDLRGGAALVVAALGAFGTTVINDCQYIIRGYEDICEDLNKLGANIEWQS